MSGPGKLGGGAGVAMPLPGGPFKKKNEKKFSESLLAHTYLGYA